MTSSRRFSLICTDYTVGEASGLPFLRYAEVKKETDQWSASTGRKDEVNFYLLITNY